MPEAARCNFINECADGSDEAGCEEAPQVVGIANLLVENIYCKSMNIKVYTFEITHCLFLSKPV